LTSSGSKSQTVVPSSTEPWRGIVPVTANKGLGQRGLPGGVVACGAFVSDRPA
jgi:hypothetical protein